MSAPCIVEVAVNGSTSRLANPNVPRTPAEIAADAISCIDAGATIVHNHNDEGLIVADGVHAADPYAESWTAILDAAPDTLLYTTMASGGPGITVASRWDHQVELAQRGLCRVGLVDPGSVSLGLMGADGLLMPLDLVYVNTHADALYMVRRCRELQLAPSISIFDPSFLRVALTFHDAAALPAGTMIKLYFGGLAPFGLPPTVPSLLAYLAMLEGTGLPWSVAVLTGDVVGCGLATAALERGGHVRVGLEDYHGPKTPTNRQLVDELVTEIERTGRSVATAEATHRVLGIPLPSQGTAS
ncbi:MAG TPA: 3-keto-5-aminohexanoate cleavage protein [Mycobacteriales bacterium]|nr:3-keto-5-aminohexanoate cleavage protein [Mycobacteriales bacterium]